MIRLKCDVQRPLYLVEINIQASSLKCADYNEIVMVIWSHT